MTVVADDLILGALASYGVAELITIVKTAFVEALRPNESATAKIDLRKIFQPVERKTPSPVLEYAKELLPLSDEEEVLKLSCEERRNGSRMYTRVDLKKLSPIPELSVMEKLCLYMLSRESMWLFSRKILGGNSLETNDENRKHVIGCLELYKTYLVELDGTMKKERVSEACTRVVKALNLQGLSNQIKQDKRFNSLYSITTRNIKRRVDLDYGKIIAVIEILLYSIVEMKNALDKLTTQSGEALQGEIPFAEFKEKFDSLPKVVSLGDSGDAESEMSSDEVKKRYDETVLPDIQTNYKVLAKMYEMRDQSKEIKETIERDELNYTLVYMVLSHRSKSLDFRISAIGEVLRDMSLLAGVPSSDVDKAMTKIRNQEGSMTLEAIVDELENKYFNPVNLARDSNRPIEYINDLKYTVMPLSKHTRFAIEAMLMYLKEPRNIISVYVRSIMLEDCYYRSIYFRYNRNAKQSIWEEAKATKTNIVRRVKYVIEWLKGEAEKVPLLKNKTNIDKAEKQMKTTADLLSSSEPVSEEIVNIQLTEAVQAIIKVKSVVTQLNTIQFADSANLFFKTNEITLKLLKGEASESDIKKYARLIKSSYIYNGNHRVSTKGIDARQMTVEHFCDGHEEMQIIVVEDGLRMKAFRIDSVDHRSGMMHMANYLLPVSSVKTTKIEADYILGGQLRMM